LSKHSISNLLLFSPNTKANKYSSNIFGCHHTSEHISIFIKADPSKKIGSEKRYATCSTHVLCFLQETFCCGWKAHHYLLSVACRAVFAPNIYTFALKVLNYLVFRMSPPLTQVPNILLKVDVAHESIQVLVDFWSILSLPFLFEIFISNLGLDWYCFSFSIENLVDSCIYLRRPCLSIPIYIEILITNYESQGKQFHKL
jgi:hypothetical protein